MITLRRRAPKSLKWTLLIAVALILLVPQGAQASQQETPRTPDELELSFSYEFLGILSSFFHIIALKFAPFGYI